uniref:Putative site-specific tyrosine recombinase n=1 Tax=viral metagenome TaxID=1070528 RepID=A0A6M3XY82_9ZZZZ
MKRKFPKKVATREEAGAIIESCERLRDRLIISLMAKIGLRVGSVIYMEYQDVDMKRGMIRIIGDKGTRSRTPEYRQAKELWKKEKNPIVKQQLKRKFLDMRRETGVDRTVAMHPDVHKLFAMYLAETGKLRPNELLFDMTIQNVHHILKRVCNKIGIKKRNPHSFRHCFGTCADEDGWKLTEIQAQMGHKDITTTTMYLKYTGTEVKKAMEKNPLDI